LTVRLLAAALAIDPAAIADVALSIETPFQLRRRGVEARIVTGLERPSIDPVLCRALARALPGCIGSGPAPRSQRSLRPRASASASSGPFALLPPQIVAAIEQSRQPAALTTELLVHTPLPSD
jgi:hypothetical protein